jgi:DNA-binding transcriptional LysR family regulator
VVACAARFSALPSWLTRSPVIATLPADIAQEMARIHGLETRPLPFDIDGYDIQMAWHRRLDEDKAAQWFRTLIQRVALETLPALREPATA